MYLFTMDNSKKIAILTFFANLYFYNHVGTLYQLARGLSLTQIGSITSIILATIFIAEIPTGVLADKIGYKWSVVIAFLLQAIGEFMYFFASSYSVFILIAVIAGLGYAFLSGAQESLVYETLPDGNKEEGMKKAMGRIGSYYQLAFFIAPIIGGLVVSQLTLSKYMTAIFLTACSVFIAFLISLTLKDVKKEKTNNGQNPILIFKEGLKEIKKSPKLIWILLLAIFTSSFSNTLFGLYQPYFAQNNVPAIWMGWALSLGALLAFYIQKNIHRLEKILGKYGIYYLTIWPGLMYIIMYFTHSAPLLIVFFIVTYASTDAKSPLFSSIQNNLISSNHRATILSFISMFTRCYTAIMALLLGMIADYSISFAFLIMGVLIIFFSTVLKTYKITNLLDNNNKLNSPNVV